MERFSIPKCECGQDVQIHMIQVPNYDESGGLETVEQEYIFDSMCEDCIVFGPAQDVQVEDELPF